MSPDGKYQYANFNELVGDYAQTRYEAELGGTEAHAEAEPQIEPLEQLIIKMKGESYFELVSELGSLYCLEDNIMVEQEQLSTLGLS